MANFSECADTLICSTLSGSNGIGISLELGTPNKIVVSASNIPNSALANNSININGTTIVLGTTGSLAIGDITAVAAGTNLTGGGTSGSLTISLTSSITGGLTNISGLTTLSSSQVSGSFSGSGALINSLTASNVSNFTNDVRAQFSAGNNIGISSGVISLSSSVSTTAVSGTTGISGALGLFTNLTGTNISGTTVQFATITGSNISGTSAQYTRITGSSITGSALTYATLSGTYISASQISGSYTGSGAGLFNLTASGISNFTNDVRAQFSAGTNITINNGQISASGGGAGTVNAGNAGYVTYYPSSNTTVDDASGSTGGLYWDNTNIRLGINTASPTYRLDVAGTGRFTSNVEVTGTIKGTGTIYGPGLILSNSSGFSSIEVGAPNGGYIDFKRPESDDYDLRIITDSTIEGGGYLLNAGGALLSLSGTNVGIGTSTPSAKLQVVGNSMFGTTTTTTNYSSVAINGDLAIQQAAPLINFVSGNGITRFGYIYHAGVTGDMQILNQQNTVLAFGTNNVNLLYLSSSNVGIGTSTPSAKLEVLGGATNDATPEFRISGSNGRIEFYNSLANNSYNPIVETGDKALIFTEGTTDTGDFVIAPWASTIRGLRMTSNGDVGIGVSVPSTTLHVNGNISGTYLAVSDKTTTAGQNEIYGKNIPKAWAKIKLSNPLVLADGYNFITKSYNWITTGQKIAISASNFTTTAMLTSASIQTSITYESSTALVAGTANAVPRVISVTSDGTYGIITIDFINHTSSLLTMTSAPYSDAVPYLNVTIFTKM